jgi:hypothetical protein
MPELDVELRDLGEALDWPDADFAAEVGARLRSPTLPPRRRRALVVALAAAAALVLALPASRAIGSWIGVDGDHITVTPTTVSPNVTAPLSIAALDLGPEVALADLRADVGFNMPVPQAAGFERPDEVHVRRPPASGEATLLYRARPDLPSTGTPDVGLLIGAFRADLDSRLMSKTTGEGTRVEQVTVQNGVGYWIEGAPHELLYRDANGQVIPDRVRLAANVLVWEVGGVTVRIESALARDDVIRVANSMR